MTSPARKRGLRDRRKALGQLARTKPLLELIPALDSRFQSPLHLAPLAAQLERSATEPVRLVAAAPPRHGKSELLCAFAAQQLIRFPQKRIIIASYSASLAERHSRRIRQLYVSMGGRLDPSSRKASLWNTSAGGQVLAAGLDGSLTGFGADSILLDDPFRSRAEAASSTIREHVHSAFQSALATRLEPGGSIFVVGTRWANDDLAGRLLKSGSYDSLTLPALDASGKALWPERYNVAQLEQIREAIGSREWASLYQGSPVPDGGRTFSDVLFYHDADIPDSGLRVTVGVDLAVSGKSDWSAAVVLGYHPYTRRVFVLDVERRRCRVEEFFPVLRRLMQDWSCHEAVWATGGQEQAIATFAATAGVYIRATPARQSKEIRATSFAAAWEAGRVSIERGAAWADAYVSELLDFPGGRHDDQVDASSSAFNALGRDAVGLEPAEEFSIPPVPFYLGEMGELVSSRGSSYDELTRLGVGLSDPDRTTEAWAREFARDHRRFRGPIGIY